MKTPLCTEQHHHPAPHLSGNVHSLSPEEIAVHSLSAPTTVERRRWQVIALLAEQTPIAEIVAASESGSAGLADGRQRAVGAAPLLSDAQQRELRQALQSPPPDGGAWTGPKVAKWIAARTGRRVHRQRGWEYLRRLGTGVTAAPTAHDDQPVDR